MKQVVHETRGNENETETTEAQNETEKWKTESVRTCKLHDMIVFVKTVNQDSYVSPVTARQGALIRIHLYCQNSAP